MAPPIHHEQYRGEPIQISTTHHPDGTWTASTHPMEKASPSATTAHPTEEDAKREALSAAVAAKDRARSHVGKP